MAHEIEMINGKASFFAVKENTWHGLGTIVQDAPTAEDAIKLAGLDWEVRSFVPYTSENGTDFSSVPSHRVLRRSTDNKILSVVSKDYEVVQNKNAFRFFDKFVDSGLASFETAGCLQEGRKVFILAKLNKAPIEVGKGDEVNKYLLLSNSHDGSMAVRVGFCPIRVVCANTLAMAHRSGGSKLLKLSHGKSVNDNLESIKNVIDAENAKFDLTSEQYNFLASRYVTEADIATIASMTHPFFGKDSERKAAAQKKAVETITNLFQFGAGQNLPGANGTYWGLYNAATEYLSHHACKTDDARTNSLWFGANKNLNESILETVTAMAAH